MNANEIACKMLNDRFIARNDFISDSNIDDFCDHESHIAYDDHAPDDDRCNAIIHAILDIADRGIIEFPLDARSMT